MEPMSLMLRGKEDAVTAQCFVKARLPCICLIADSALSGRSDEGSPKVPSKLNYPFISSPCWKEEAVQ